MHATVARNSSTNQAILYMSVWGRGGYMYVYVDDELHLIYNLFEEHSLRRHGPYAKANLPHTTPPKNTVREREGEAVLNI